MTIELAIANLQAKVLSLSGMKAAPATPPEGTGAYPFGVTYERSGEMILNSYGFADDLSVLWTEIHVSRANLSTGIVQAMAFRDPFLKLLIADPTLGGTVSTIRNILRTFGKLEWNGIETLGYRFEIGVKVTLTI